MDEDQEVMRVPDCVELNGFPVKTKYNPTLLADREIFGEYCTRMMDITIDSNLSPNRTLLTWSHEIVEAIISINHLSIEDEEVKQAIGISIYQLLMQHKKFFCKKEP